MTIAVLPGTFDPITVGHLDIVQRALAVADEVIVGVAHNATKTPLLGVKERVRLASDATAHLDGVSVEAIDGLLVDFCTERGATLIVKGLRSGADFDGERPMGLMNRALTGIETVFILGDGTLSHVASSLIRDIARHGGDISDYVPAGVAEAVMEAVSRSR